MALSILSYLYLGNWGYHPYKWAKKLVGAHLVHELFGGVSLPTLIAADVLKNGIKDRDDFQTYNYKYIAI